MCDETAGPGSRACFIQKNIPMKIVMQSWILITGLLCCSFSGEKTWVIDPESRLAIRGVTNVNTFTCKVNSYSGHDTLRYFCNNVASKLEFTTNRMTVPVRSFNCGSPQISKDFHKTLRSDRYPRLDINFISLENTALKHDSFVNGVLDITLAGVTTRYTVRFALAIKNNTMLLSGLQPVKFSDFRLKAPEKLKGLIRVQEGLNVEFHLVLKAV
jgi:hypothetical protein